MAMHISLTNLRQFVWQQNQTPSRVASPVAQLAEKQQAAKDIWDTEILSDAAAAELTKLRTLLERSATLSADDVREIVTDDFVCGDLLAPETIANAASQEIESSRWSRFARKSLPRVAQARGAACLLRRLIELRDDLPVERRHASFKIIRVTSASASFSTLVRYEGSGGNDSHSRQHVANYGIASGRCRWKAAKSEDPN